MLNRFTTVLAIILALSVQSFAQGNLLITPMRVVFEGNKQRTELNLMNSGSDTARYSISFRQYKMAEAGNLVLTEKPDTVEMPADPYLRIYPRQVMLPPGESQAVMLQCRRTANMQPGEYRSHLWFRSEKNYEELGKEKPVLDSTQLSVSVTAIFGMTIPVIIRSGEVNVSATITDLQLDYQQDSIPVAKFTINRSGNISIYGNLTVEFFPVTGKPYEIGKIKNAAVYTNIDKRYVAIKLRKSPGMSFKNGRIVVRYASPDEAKYVVYAEAGLEVQ